MTFIMVIYANIYWAILRFLNNFFLYSNNIDQLCDKELFSVKKSVYFSSVAQLGMTLYNLMNCSTPGLPVHHQLSEFTQIYVH